MTGPGRTPGARSGTALPKALDVPVKWITTILRWQPGMTANASLARYFGTTPCVARKSPWMPDRRVREAPAHSNVRPVVTGSGQLRADASGPIWLSVSNSLSGRHWELDQVPAVGDRTDIVQLGTGHHVAAGEGQRRVALQRRVAAYLVGGGQTPGATQRCLNPGFSEKIGDSRRTARRRYGVGAQLGEEAPAQARRRRGQPGLHRQRARGRLPHGPAGRRVSAERPAPSAFETRA